MKQSEHMQLFEFNLTRDIEPHDRPGKRGAKPGQLAHPQKPDHPFRTRGHVHNGHSSGKRIVRDENGFRWEKSE